MPHDEGDDSGGEAALLRGDGAPLPLGFVTDKLVACAARAADRRGRGSLGQRAVERRHLDRTAAGDLVVQFPTGVARIALDTGELADRRCGWSFGLSDQLPEARRGGPSICLRLG